MTEYQRAKVSLRAALRHANDANLILMDIENVDTDQRMDTFDAQDALAKAIKAMDAMEG